MTASQLFRVVSWSLGLVICLHRPEDLDGLLDSLFQLDDNLQLSGISDAEIL